MDMSGMGMGSDGDGMDIPLNDTGVDFSNMTQAEDFLGEILDDTEFQVIGNAYARYFWYGVVVLIGICAIFNMIQKTILRMRYVYASAHGLQQKLTSICRLRGAAAKAAYPARPSNIFTKSTATVTAILREASYMQLTPTGHAFWIKVPPFGTISLLLVYLGFVLALEFIDNDIPGAQHYTALGLRAGWLAIAQVPLLILLAGKNNLIGFVTGVSYERLNVLHRWVSRMLLLLATLHLGYQNYGWDQYGLRQLEWSTDSCPPTGIAAYAILLWINLTTFAPMRNFSYEFFVVQHLITFFGFIIAIMFHLPSTALYSRVWIYIPIVLYFLDRVIRTSRYAYNNITPGHASLTALDGGVTKIRVPVKHIKRWKPGSHVLLSIPRLGLGQSHPATIASIPSSHNNDLIFILKGHRGFTNRLVKSATSSTTSLLPSTKQDSSTPQQTHIALIDGPYGGSQSDFAAFDSVLLIAGSTGITFILPILLDIAHRASSSRLPVRHLSFVWVIKNTAWTSWISNELISAFQTLRNAGIETELKIFVTCDDTFTEGSSEPTKKTGCQCDKSLGPCCCVRDATTKNETETDAITRSGSESSILNEKPQPHTTEITTTSLSPSAPCSNNNNNKTSQLASLATFKSGRPDTYALIWQLLDQAEGESGVACCGPVGLNARVRNAVVRCSDERAVHKGTGEQGVYCHVEGFAW